MNLHITPSFIIDCLCKTASVLLFLVIVVFFNFDSRHCIFMLNIRLRRYSILNAKLCIKEWNNIYEWFLISSFGRQHLDSCACVVKTTWHLSSHRIYRRHMCRSPANPSVGWNIRQKICFYDQHILLNYVCELYAMLLTNYITTKATKLRLEK